MNRPNHALQRTPGFGVQLPSAAVVRPAQSRAVLPAMKPGTARAFASRRRAHSRVPGPESLSLGSLGASAFTLTKMILGIGIEPTSRPSIERLYPLSYPRFRPLRVLLHLTGRKVCEMGLLFFV